MVERNVQHESWGPLGQGGTDLFDHPVLDHRDPAGVVFLGNVRVDT